MPDLLHITDPFADVGIIVACLACVAFVVSYAGFFKWRLTPAGRSLMYFVLALLSVAIISYLARWFGPEYWGRVVLRPLTWWAVAITAIRLTVVLWTSSSEGSSIDIKPRNNRTDKEFS
ncbi:MULTISPECIES: hypothetical protein [unclassified Microbacterium]|uniref:putative phage holin n=1 Tax=unclassified Microbacterium TaxID=2609290 RepID=UPI0038678DD0